MWQLEGKACVLTGATSGIGYHAAFLVARTAGTVAIVGRSKRRVDATVAELKAAGASEARGYVADLSSQKSIRALAAQLLQDVPRIDVLLNNAASVTRDRRETVDGIEYQFAVNHLAPFLLTNLLLPRLAESAPSRVVTTASQVERHGSIDFDDLQGRKKYDPQRAYRQSKLANILFTRELARRVGNRGITPLCLHPGVYTTRLLDDYEGWSPLVTKVMGRGLPGPEQGAAVLLNAISNPELQSMPGAYLHETRVAEPSAQARDAELAKKLWEVSEQLTGLASA